MVTALRMSGMMERAEISSVPGIASSRPFSSLDWLKRLSLPEMKGAEKPLAASRQPSAARTSAPSCFGSSGLPQQKLSSRAARAGSAPTQVRLRSASSTQAMAIQ